ncbi:unnamed protein product (mitochondrion) [Plasmodiophora brassicae]|uniref:J domain-containing protein n=2 Tax=Plasmodiophora brassicae TaxID=37360 RepID=A0A3P3YA02_PLABS|nr:unnamed protein product [Plasmodiophora brassicae]
MAGRTVLLVACGAIAVACLASAHDPSDDLDLYDVLGLDYKATDADIKKAFRKLSLKLHPDKNPGSDQTRFLNVQRAHAVLSDPDLRAVYDMQGLEGVKQVERIGVQNLPRSGDYRVEVKVTLEQFYNGAEQTFTINREVVCRACRGTGARNAQTVKCKACHGRGKTHRIQELAPGFNVQMEVPCPVCHGTGQSFKHKCPVCGGTRLVNEPKELKLMIERGTPDNHEVVFERASQQAIGQLPGHVIVVLRPQPHKHFQRVSATDLVRTMVISLRDALLGFTRTFEHLDGHKVSIDRKGKITPHGFREEISGEGMPIKDFPSERGLLTVEYHVKFPSSLTEQQRNALPNVFRASAVQCSHCDHVVELLAAFPNETDRKDEGHAGSKDEL